MPKKVRTVEQLCELAIQGRAVVGLLPTNKPMPAAFLVSMQAWYVHNRLKRGEAYVYTRKRNTEAGLRSHKGNHTPGHPIGGCGWSAAEAAKAKAAKIAAAGPTAIRGQEEGAIRSQPRSGPNVSGDASKAPCLCQKEANNVTGGPKRKG